MSDSLEKAIVDYLEQNSCYIVKDGVLECSDGSCLEMFVCAGPDVESMSIVSFNKHDGDDDDWMNVDTNKLHKSYLESAMLELEEFVELNRDIIPIDSPKLCYHHVDIIRGQDNALIRMHWNIQNQSDKDSTRGDKWEEKIYFEVTNGVNLDKHQKLVKELELKGDKDAAGRLQSVIDSFFAHSDYRNLEDWIARNESVNV